MTNGWFEVDKGGLAKLLGTQTARLAQEWRDSDKRWAEMRETVDRARRAKKAGQRTVPRPQP